MSDDPTEFVSVPIDTGFTAAVTASETPSQSEEPSELSQEAVQAAKALVNLPSISSVELAQLAREIAQDIEQLGAILARHKLTKAHYDFLEQHNKFFKTVLEGEIRNWQSVKSTEARLRMQAQAALEQQMPVIGQRMGSAAEKLSDVVEAAKLFADIAGVKSAPSGPATIGERYQITIDLGAGSDVVIAAKSQTPAGAVAPVAGALPGNSQAGDSQAALRPNGQRQIDLRALPQLPEG